MADELGKTIVGRLWPVLLTLIALWIALLALNQVVANTVAFYAFIASGWAMAGFGLVLLVIAMAEGALRLIRFRRRTSELSVAPSPSSRLPNVS